MEKINTQKEYSEYVNKKSPNSPILKDCFNAKKHDFHRTFLT